jgi:hypothetical protein
MTSCLFTLCLFTLCLFTLGILPWREVSTGVPLVACWYGSGDHYIRRSTDNPRCPAPTGP